MATAESTTAMSPRVVILLVSGLLALTGCTRSGASDDPGGVASPPTSREEPSGGDAGDPGPIGARVDLTEFECAREKAKWSATGSLTNSGDKPATYRVKVTVSDREAGTVLGSEEQSIPLDPEETRTISFREFYSSTKKKTICTARVVKGSE